jgi:hypothetical protein
MRSHSSTSNFKKASGRAGLRRQAQRTLLICLAALLISSIPGGWLIDHCPYHIRDPEAGTTIALWEKANPHPDVLILGSSRLGTFLRTSELRGLASRFCSSKAGNIFNASLPAGEPIAMQFLTRKLLGSKVPPPRLVLVEMSPDLLSRDNPYFKYVITRDLVAADLPKYIDEILLSGLATSRLLSSRLTPFFVHRTQLVNWAVETVGKKFAKEEPRRAATAPAAVEGLSFQSQRDDAEKSSVPLVDRIERGTRRFRSRLQHYDIASRTSEAFEATVALLHARGCAIVLVQPPLTSAQRALFTTEVRRPFGDFLQRLKGSYGCEFVDFSDRLPDTLFTDNQHGNNAGSIAFTELLAREVIAPAWRNLVLPKTGD